MVLVACTEQVVPELSADMEFDFILVDGEYELRYHPISNEVFQDKFQIGWKCVGIHDVYSDCTIGDGNLVLELVGGSLVSPFSVLPNESVKLYNLRWLDLYSYKISNYSYNEENNELYIKELENQFTGGTVISITDDEMRIIAPKYSSNYSDPESVLNLFRFEKLSEETVAQMDAIYTTQEYW